jgi:plastocyanin
VRLPDVWPTEPSAAVTTEVEMDLCAFVPTVAHVEPGDTVTFRNLNPGMPHTVTGVGGGMLGWDQRTDDSLTWTAPDQPGVYPYACCTAPRHGRRDRCW